MINNTITVIGKSINELIIETGIDPVKRKCLYINKDQKAVTRNKELYNLSQILNIDSTVQLYIEMEKSYLCLDLGFVCFNINKYISLDNEIYSDFIDDISYFKDFDYNKIKENFLQCAEQNYYFNVSEIELLRLAGESAETVQKLIISREHCLQARETKNKLEHELKIKSMVDESNNSITELNNKVEAIEKLIIDAYNSTTKTIIKNDKFELVTFNEKGQYNERKDINIINYLFKQYNINVPLKTQGWINNALHDVSFNTDNMIWAYDYYTSSTNSTVFSNYLNQLISAILEKHGVDNNHKETEIQDIENKKYDNIIPKLKFECENKTLNNLIEFKRRLAKNHYIPNETDLKRVYAVIYKTMKEYKIRELMSCVMLFKRLLNSNTIDYIKGKTTITAMLFSTDKGVKVIFKKEVEGKSGMFYHAEIMLDDLNCIDVNF